MSLSPLHKLLIYQGLMDKNEDLCTPESTPCKCLKILDFVSEEVQIGLRRVCLFLESMLVNRTSSASTGSLFRQYSPPINKLWL